jgi:hypothetical protein
MRNQAFWRSVHAAAAGLAWQMEVYMDETPSKDLASSWAFRLRALADYIEGKRVGQSPDPTQTVMGQDAESSRLVFDRKIDGGIFDLRLLMQAMDMHVGEK